MRPIQSKQARSRLLMASSNNRVKNHFPPKVSQGDEENNPERRKNGLQLNGLLQRELIKRSLRVTQTRNIERRMWINHSRSCARPISLACLFCSRHGRWRAIDERKKSEKKKLFLFDGFQLIIIRRRTRRQRQRREKMSKLKIVGVVRWVEYKKIQSLPRFWIMSCGLFFRHCAPTHTAFSNHRRRSVLSIGMRN
jgi:hypothetical protein